MTSEDFKKGCKVAKQEENIPKNKMSPAIGGPVVNNAATADQKKVGSTHSTRPRPVFFWNNADVLKWLSRHCQEHHDLYAGLFLEHDITGKHNGIHLFAIRLIPDRTLAHKDENCRGVKRMKRRITVLLCCNSTGTDKRRLLIIGKSAKPRCFRNFSPHFYCTYTSNSKEWMTSSIFQEWLLQFNKQLVSEGRRILLLLDNATSHCVPNDGLSNIKIHFLPPNMTASLQPLDSGIIKRRSLVRLNDSTLQRMGITDKDHREELYREILKLKLKSDILEMKDLERKGSEEVFSELLDQTALIDAATFFDAAHIPTRVTSYGIRDDAYRLDSQISSPSTVPSTTGSQTIELSWARLHLANSCHAMLRSELVVEHLATTIEKTSAAIADMTGEDLWSGWSSFKVKLLAEVRSLHVPCVASNDQFARARRRDQAQI
ncbi:TIGD6 [Cordylochernes scorpioides]|uniref:TIGD6 n=1 Tax=Cordylochernes scorpioides TaxID=51811 RepID=A0ABY6KYK8_9ARAC|nr:TIGD6 [Cordylochernes scorpioides]